MQKTSLLCLVALTVVSTTPAFADDPPKTPEQLELDARLAEFTKKMQDANYGELFKKAAAEFNVPVEVLMGVSFAETRWEHLTWPPGETVSPDNGMPRPYGIMSLWDNEYFGHSLLEAAELIKKSPEDLKKDPLDNMRGGAALLRKLYEKTPKPEWAKEGLESWNYAIREYCGIPEMDLKSRHAMDVYDFLQEGYDQYGIKLPQVEGLKLDKMREETKKIVEEERAKQMAAWTPADFEAAGITPPARERKTKDEPAPAQKPTAAPIAAATPAPSTPWGLIVVLVLTAAALAFFIFRKNPETQKQQTKK